MLFTAHSFLIPVTCQQERVQKLDQADRQWSLLVKTLAFVLLSALHTDVSQFSSAVESLKVLNCGRSYLNTQTEAFLWKRKYQQIHLKEIQEARLHCAFVNFGDFSYQCKRPLDSPCEVTQELQLTLG